MEASLHFNPNEPEKPCECETGDCKCMNEWTIEPDKESGLFILKRNGLHYRGPETKEFLEAYLDLIMRDEEAARKGN